MASAASLELALIGGPAVPLCLRGIHGGASILTSRIYILGVPLTPLQQVTLSHNERALRLL
ncbi:hypothetical protein DSP71_15260 [Microbacterium sp. H6]|nr:hypothetical protein DSP71_15260 [Microbacterium sp. H6]